jgi:hypothetical protein
MAVVEYVSPLGENARKRHSHETVKGTVVTFVVQLEVCVEDEWRPVVRYDTAHGISHIDWYRRSGESRKELLPLSFAEALTVADEDIQDRWEEYRDRYLRGEWP